MRFSVIIPLYNKAPYIEKALQSIINQSFSDYELVIVDDGSQDGSLEIAERFLSGLTVSYRIVRQGNAGVSIARNNGVSESHGDYLCFLDADDWWSSIFLEGMSGLIDKFPDAGIYGTGYIIVNETKHKTREAKVAVGPGFEEGYINFFQVYAENLTMPLWTGAVCLSRRVFDEMQGFPKGIKLGEDFLLWGKVALKYPVAFLNKPLAFYNQDADPQWRAVSHLQDPSVHMLWNLGFLEEEEKKNSDLKQLIDNLRVTNLLPYFLSKQYRESARKELDKVVWAKQPPKVRTLYRQPMLFLKCRQVFFQMGSLVKQVFYRYI